MVILYELVLAAITILPYVLVVQAQEVRGVGVFVLCLILVNVVVRVAFVLLGGG
jgi:hypothetical protein